MELSEWLKLMLAEIARKREEETRARAEQAERTRRAPSPGKAEKPASRR